MKFRLFMIFSAGLEGDDMKEKKSEQGRLGELGGIIYILTHVSPDYSN